MPLKPYIAPQPLQGKDVLEYLRQKYASHKANIKPEEKERLEIFDPYINPDEGYIPYCQNCLDDFDVFKNKPGPECEMDHNRACLWFDYFERKINRLFPGVIIVLKKTKNLDSSK